MDIIQKYVPFYLDDKCVVAFDRLKKALVTTPILQPPKWREPFNIMCDASDYALGAVLGQQEGKNLNVIHYAGRLSNVDQKHFGTTEKSC